MAKKEKKMTYKQIISNNLFILKLIFEVEPSIIFIDLLFTVAQAGIGFLSSAFMLRYALNGINEEKSFEHLAMVLLIFMFICIGVNMLSSWYYNCVYYLSFQDIRKKFRDIVYQKAISVELGCYENPQYYDNFVKAIDECEKRVSLVLDSVTNIVSNIITFSANFALVIYIDPIFLLFALIPLMIIPLQSKVKKIDYDKNMKITEENRCKDYSRRVFYLSDYAKEMRLTNMPELMVEKFKSSGEKVIGIIKKYGVKLVVLNYIIQVCNDVLSVLGATFYAVWRTFVTQSIGYGDCLIIVNSINNISYTLTNSTNMLLAFQENAMYIQNLRDFLDYQPKILDGDLLLPGNGDIVLDNVSFKYDGAEEYTLKNISMTFKQNKKTAIVGHNGAGKTTLVKLIMRLYDAEGKITYGGVDIKNLNVKAYRNIFSAVMQDFHVFALTVAENVLLKIRAGNEDETVIKALERSGLKDKVEKFEKGINSVMTKEFDNKGESLSGGEQQKLAIAHVYSKDNKFVILDEPSSALDPIAEYEMFNNMSLACANCGMIFISHRLSSAVDADEIYLLENGQIVEHGSHREIMNFNGKYADMFRKQALNYTE